MTTTYDTDFYAWTQQQAELLRQGALSAIDREHLAEEIESMGKSERRALESYLAVVIMHLLKWQYQPRLRSGSWRQSIRNGRYRIARLLKENPSLKQRVVEIAPDEYGMARENAADETGLPLATFPEACPFTVEQITGDWWPE